jgi:hypothetical protein
MFYLLSKGEEKFGVARNSMQQQCDKIGLNFVIWANFGYF